MNNNIIYPFMTVKDIVNMYQLKEDEWDILIDSYGNETFYAESIEKGEGIAVKFAIELALATELEMISDFAILYYSDLKTINRKEPVYSLRISFI